MSVSPYYHGLDDFAFPVVADAVAVSGDDARIVQVCDAVVAAIRAGLPVDDETTVSRVYLPDVDAETLASADGRRCYVFPAAYDQVEAVTRAEDRNEYRVGVLVVERYAAAGDMADAGAPRAWADAQVKWVEGYVYDLLGEVRAAGLAAAVAAEGLYPETAGVGAVYDPELLRQHKLFWSEATVAFRRDE